MDSMKIEMKIEIDLDTVLNEAFDNSSDDDLVPLKQLLEDWLVKVHDEIDFVREVQNTNPDE
jgi:hypothetical protein